MQRHLVPVVLVVGLVALMGCGSATSTPSTSTSSVSAVSVVGLSDSITLTPARRVDAVTTGAVAAILQRRASTIEPDAHVDVAGKAFVVRYRQPSSTAALRLIGERGVFGDRVVIGEYPAHVNVGQQSGRQYTCATLVHPSARGNEAAFLWDVRHDNCYEVGPVLLDNTSIVSAEAVHDPAQGGWLVLMTHRGTEFQDRIARPYVLKQVAMVVDDVVLSAPTINPGITGGEVEITGNFTAAQARVLAAALTAGPLPVELSALPAQADAPR